MVYNMILNMLRLEQGFDDSLFESDHKDLVGYTNHHRLVVPALIAHDTFQAGHSEYATKHRLEMVMDGTRRTATLAFEADNVKEASHNLGWLAIRDEIDFDEVGSPWRIIRRDDPHFGHPGVNAWAATRNLLKLPLNAPDERSTRIRERYTFTALEAIHEDDIRAILIENEAPEEVMMATATVYAINKLVPKPMLRSERVDMSKFPALSASIHRG